jgi:epidermal growth factor receptor substrate 15
MSAAAGGPLPRIEGINAGLPNSPIAAQATGGLQAQGTGGPIRVPPLAPEKANQYAALFQQSGAQNGTLSGMCDMLPYQCAH